MTTELLLFIMVALVGIVSATAMLASNNPVHSALFLIINFACVAFLYLMLEAPFLAMIQIAVYAGAIMVLFLFVIMLLGADKLGQTAPGRYRWFSLSAMVLSVIFLLTVGLVLVTGNADLRGPEGAQPLLRVVNTAPDSVELDVFMDNELIAEAVGYNEVTNFIPLEAGEHTLAFAPANTSIDSALISQPVNLLPGAVQSLVLYGQSLLPGIAFIDEDLSAPAGYRAARVNVFNAYTGAPTVKLVDIGSDDELTISSETSQITDRVLIDDVPQGTSVALVQDESVNDWAFVSPANEVIFRLRDYEIERHTQNLLVITEERLFDDTLRPLAYPIVSEGELSFGGPESVGQLLFTRYLLPFEMVAILLLIAMIGAIVLTHTEGQPVRRRDNVRRRVRRSLSSVVAEQIGHDVAVLPSETGEQREPAGD